MSLLICQDEDVDGLWLLKAITAAAGRLLPQMRRAPPALVAPMLMAHLRFAALFADDFGHHAHDVAPGATTTNMMPLRHEAVLATSRQRLADFAGH